MQICKCFSCYTEDKGGEKKSRLTGHAPQLAKYRPGNRDLLGPLLYPPALVAFRIELEFLFSHYRICASVTENVNLFLWDNTFKGQNL